MNETVNQGLSVVISVGVIIFGMYLLTHPMLSWNLFWINWLLFLAIIFVILGVRESFQKRYEILDDLEIINNKSEFEEYISSHFNKNIEILKSSEDEKRSFTLKEEDSDNVIELEFSISLNEYSALMYLINKKCISHQILSSIPNIGGWESKNPLTFYRNPKRQNGKFILNSDEQESYNEFEVPILFESIKSNDYPLIIKRGVISKQIWRFNPKNLLNSVNSISQIIKNFK